LSHPRAYLLSLGSNIESGRWVPRALELLRARFEVEAVSQAYDVAAVGFPDQPRYVNLAVRLRSDLPLQALRVVSRHIEGLCGRVRVADRCAARTLDLDVVYEGDTQAAVDAGLLTEAYVLVPCADVWPDALLAAGGRTLGEEAAARFPVWRQDHRAEDV
jgi:2-amino-4-hydroxy-6-hydroxymethyldihydropteridine diphosphokinase